MNNKDTINSILDRFEKVRREDIAQNKSRTGSPCTKSYASSNSYLRQNIEWLNTAYAYHLGVKRAPNERYFLTHLMDITYGRRPKADIEKHFENFWKCNQYDPAKYQVKGEPIQGGKKSKPATAQKDPSITCAYENEAQEAKEADPANISKDLVILPFYYMSDDYLEETIKRNGWTPKQCKLGGNRKSFLYERMHLYNKFDKEFKDRIEKCQADLTTDQEFGCFRETLIYRADAINCIYEKYKNKSFDKRTCFNNATENANARLQQLGCQRRIRNGTSLSEDEMFLPHPQLNDVANSHSRPFHEVSRSFGLNVNGSIENGQFHKEPWGQIDVKYLTCVRDTQFDLIKKYFLEDRELKKNIVNQCGAISYDRSYDENRNVSFFSFDFPDSLVDFDAVTKLIPENQVRMAKFHEGYRHYFYVRSSDPLEVKGKKYWGFNIYVILNRQGELVKFWGYTGAVSGNKALDLDENYNVKFSDDGQLLFKDNDTNDQEVFVSCDPKYYQAYLNELQDRFNRYVRNWDNELHRLDCFDEPNSPVCIEKATEATNDLNDKRLELQGKLTDYALKTNPVCTTEIAKLANLKIDDTLKRFTASETTHYEQDCTKQNGTVVTAPSGETFCKFDAPSCPKGWRQHENWSTTESINYACNIRKANINFKCRDKSITHEQKESLNTLTLEGHSWGNIPIETTREYSGTGSVSQGSVSVVICRDGGEKYNTYISGPHKEFTNVCGQNVLGSASIKYKSQTEWGDVTNWVIINNNLDSRKIKAKVKSIGCK